MSIELVRKLVQEGQIFPDDVVKNDCYAMAFNAYIGADSTVTVIGVPADDFKIQKLIIPMSDPEMESFEVCELSCDGVALFSRELGNVPARLFKEDSRVLFADVFCLQSSVVKLVVRNRSVIPRIFLAMIVGDLVKEI